MDKGGLHEEDVIGRRCSRSLDRISGGAQAAGKKTLAFVVNGASDFWKIAEAGIKKAQAELPDYNLVLKYPEQASVGVQQRLMDDLVAAGVSAIMVSAVDPKTQTEAWTASPARSRCSPPTATRRNRKRLAYIGSCNIGRRQAGGRVHAEGAAERRQMHRLRRSARRRQCEGPHRRRSKTTIKGSKVELIDVRADDIDQARAKRNVEDAITAHPDVTCFVGFYSYNTPRIYEALKEAGKLGKITDHRLRRGSGHAWRRQGRHDHRHRRPAAL